jgi:hypothetical protein
VDELNITIEGRTLRVTAETYVGLWICGPDDLVERVRSLLAQQIQ